MSPEKTEELGHRKFVRRLFGASAYITGGQLGVVLLNYGAIAILARYLGLRELGIYFMLTEVGRIGSIFCQAGASQSSQKFLGRMIYANPSSLPVVQRKIASLLIVTSLLTIAVISGLWGLVATRVPAIEKIHSYAFYGCVMIFVTTYNAYHGAVLRATDKMWHSILSMGLIQKAVFLLFLVYIVLSPSLHLTLDRALISWTIAGGLSALAGEIFVHMQMRKLRATESKAQIEDHMVPGYREIFFTSLPMGVATGMATLRNSVDVLIAGSLIGPAAAGIYGPVKMLANLILFVLQAVRQALPAAIASGWGILPLKEIEDLVRRGANYAALVALPFALVLIFGGEVILRMGFGNNLAGHGELLAVLVVGPLVGALLGAPGAILQVLGHHKLQMYIIGGVTIISVSLMPIVAKIFGLLAMGMFASSMVAVQNSVLCYWAFSRLGIRSYINPLTIIRIDRHGAQSR